jgi:putative phosphoesterase
MRIVVLADTHLRPGATRRLPPIVYQALEQADAVLHAGDIVTVELLDELREYAPVHAVLGNNDTEPALAVLPGALEVDLGGVRVAMVHDSGPSKGRAGRTRRRFPMADIVVFGHSHIPMNEHGVSGQLLFNPGSATERRRQPNPTFGILDLADGAVRRATIETVSA